MALSTALQKVEALYVAYYGRAGDPSGVAYWVNQLNSGKSFSDLAGYFAVQTESKAAYPYLANPGLVDPTSFVTQVYQNLFARAPDAGGLNYWVAALNANNGNPGFVAQFINYVIGGAAPADATVLDNKVAAGTYFSQVIATKGLDIIGPDGQLTPEGAAAAKAATGPLVTGDPASVAASKLATDAFDVTTAFHLTTATDNIIGTSGSDTITAGALAPNGTTAATTLNVLDTINGGGGNDTLVVDATGGENGTIQGTITNVENLTIIGGSVATFDASPFSGIIKLQQSNANLAANGLTGQTVILDRVGDGNGAFLNYADTQATANLKAVGLVGNSIFSIAGAALKTVNLEVDKTAASKSISVTNAGGTVETLNVTAAGATTVQYTLGALKTLNVAGAGAVLFNGVSSPTDSLDASANTGGVTFFNTLADTATFIGGSGKDTIQVGASTKTISMGGGDDLFALSGNAFGAGGSADGGEGIDTFFMQSPAATVATSTPELGKALADSISNFEKFMVGGPPGIATIDVQYLDGINYLISSGTGGGNTLTFNNIGANATFESTAVQGATVTLNLKDATGASDVLNLKFAADTGYTNTADIVAAGVETLHIVTSDSDATTAPSSVFTVPIVADAVKFVTVSGDIGIDFSGGLSAATLISLDASGVTATGALGGVKYTSGALVEAANIKGGAGNDIFDLSAATKSVTVDGGGGNDSITGTDFNDTVTGGAGDDSITSGTGLDILTGGAGKDTFTLAVNSNGNIYATITDASAGDILSFVDKGAEDFIQAKVVLADTAVFQDYLNEAAKGDGSTNGILSWFQFGGNTYVVEDMSALTSFENNIDLVVKLSGLVDVSTAAHADNVLTLA